MMVNCAANGDSFASETSSYRGNPWQRGITSFDIFHGEQGPMLVLYFFVAGLLMQCANTWEVTHFFTMLDFLACSIGNIGCLDGS